MVPTYLFVGTLLIMIVAGVFRVRGQWRAPGSSLTASTSSTGHCGGESLVAAESLRQRLHGAHRRGSRKQRRESLPRTSREKCAAHPHRDYFYLGHFARGNFVPGEGLRHRGNRSGPARLPEHSFHVAYGNFRPRYFLLRDHRRNLGGAFAFRQHRFRRFSQALPRHLSRQLFAARFRLSRPAPGLQLRHRSARAF